MKLSKVRTLGVLIGVALFSGCAGTKNIIVKTPESSLMNDKDKAYIVFTTSRYPSPLGSKEKNPFFSFQGKVMEFESKTFKPTYLGTFDEMQKYIHRVNPGKHFYLIDSGFGGDVITSKRIIEIDAKLGEVYNVDSALGAIVPDSRKELTDKIKNSTCTPDTLKRYGFFSKLDSQFESDLLRYKIKCQGTNVVEVIDQRALSFDDIQKATLVESSVEALEKFNKKPKHEDAASSYVQEKEKNSEAENYQKEIAELYPIMIGTHKNAFHLCPRAWMSSLNAIEVIQSTKDDFASKFQGIKLSDSNEIGTTEQKYIDDFNSKIIKKLDENKIQSSGDIAIKYQINNYIHGNQALRYFGITEKQRLDGMSSLLLNVKFIDIKSNNVVGEINYVAIMYGGAFGGTIGLLDDAASDIVEYAKMNYIK